MAAVLADRPIPMTTTMQMTGSPRIAASQEGRAKGLSNDVLWGAPDRPARVLIRPQGEEADSRLTMVNEDRSRLKSEGAPRCRQDRSLLMPALVRKAKHLWPQGESGQRLVARRKRLGRSAQRGQ